MLRPGSLACPAPARTFTTELSWAGSPRIPMSVITGWLIIIYHRQTFTGWTVGLMGCERITRIFTNLGKILFGNVSTLDAAGLLVKRAKFGGQLVNRMIGVNFPLRIRHGNQIRAFDAHRHITRLPHLLSEFGRYLVERMVLMQLSGQ